MRPVSFGKIAVPVSGTPVLLGQSVLGVSALSSDVTLSVTSAIGFCQDMIPFKMVVDPTGTPETVVVTAISGTTFSVQRGADRTNPTSHLSGVSVASMFKFAGWYLSAISGNTGIVYLGTRNLVLSSKVGVIKQFAANSAPGVDDFYQFMAEDDRGNSMSLTDYAIDAVNSNEGLYVALWER